MLSSFAGEGSITDMEVYCSRPSNEVLTQAVNTFVFGIWSDTIYASTPCPISLPALQVSYRSTLLQRKLETISLECYIKDEAAKLFRINQSIATHVQQYQKAFGFGTWNAAQEESNWLLDRQMVQWETDLKAISESLQRLESTRRQEIASNSVWDSRCQAKGDHSVTSR